MHVSREREKQLTRYQRFTGGVLLFKSHKKGTGVTGESMASLTDCKHPVNCSGLKHVCLF